MDKTAGPRPTPPSTRRGLLIGVVIGLCGTLVLVLAAAWMLGWLDEDSSSIADSSSDSSEHTVSIDTEHLAVELTVPGDVAINHVDVGPIQHPELDCRTVRYEFGGGLTVEAFAADCEVDASQQIQNGWHGAYRTLEDVPDPVDVTDMATGAGPAEIFVQEYAEYTNSSNFWDEPVAIVLLTEPVDADFPTLVLRSDKGELSREELTDIVFSLSTIENYSD
ncbi:hypothetical protein [Glycomyces salinus]|uniref:hypothetical protein n=1 Tax=Glycomyces salinus TaxID=980294 RepID=UPI0018EB0DC5|nr:hypothetical protein [Glycomyces salinus]